MRAIGITSVLAMSAMAAATATASASSVGVKSLAGMRDLGAARPTTNVHLAVNLGWRNERELDALVAAQSDPRSPLYRKFLTAQQLRAEFAPSAAEYAKTIAALRRAGFSIARTSPDRVVVDAEGPIATAERYFSTDIHAVAQPGHGTRYANVRPARIPAELSAVRSVAGLDNLVTYRTSLDAARQAGALRGTALPEAIRNKGFGPDGGYGPFPVAQAYDYPVQHGFTGTRFIVADLIDGAFDDTLDIKPFLKQFGVKRSGPATNVVLVNGGCGGIFGCFDSFSAAGDADAIIGTAPGVSYTVYQLTGLSNAGIIDGYDQVVSDDSVDIVNISFAGCETVLGEAAIFADTEFKAGSALGITFEVVNFGGSHPCPQPGPTVQSPGDSAYALSIGGADLTIDAKGALTNVTGNSGSGGGVSQYFAEPKYQSKTSGITAGGRNSPDVAGPAGAQGTGPSIYFSGFGGWVGGFAFVDNAFVGGALAEMAQLHGGRLGLVNPSLYATFNKYGYTVSPGGTLFTDVTAGCDNGGLGGPYCAVAGYDNVTGVGTFDAYDLARYLK